MSYPWLYSAGFRRAVDRSREAGRSLLGCERVYLENAQVLHERQRKLMNQLAELILEPAEDARFGSADGGGADAQDWGDVGGGLAFDGR